MEEQKNTAEISRVLVTGAAGFIGSHTCDALLQKGKTVAGIDNLSTGSLANLSDAQAQDAFSFHQADICETGEIAKLFTDFQPDAVIHLAALVSVPIAEKNPEENYRANILGTKTVAQAAAACTTSRIVFASSAAVYGNSDHLPLSEEESTNPINQYGKAKLEAESLLLPYEKSHGMIPTCLRFFNVYGPRQDPSSPYSGVISIFSMACRNGNPVTIYGDGHQTRDFVFVKDIARAVVASATNTMLPGGIYNLCSGNGITLLELLETMKTIHQDIPEPLFKEKREGDLRHSLGDPSRARRILGFSVTTGFSEGILKLQTSRQ
ncbi:MAG: NAD-dependent epimerase/dehydratase family protein [Verrucomicrobiota bacterium]|nr:NAD-dependent epimerase/dehydratase family protein [Verrucomicrobiota bacterium]